MYVCMYVCIYPYLLHTCMVVWIPKFTFPSCEKTLPIPTIHKYTDQPQPSSSKMSFVHELAYRGCTQVLGFNPSSHNKRPGILEANSCVRRICNQEKMKVNVMLQCNPENGIKCVDMNPSKPNTILENSVFEIAHCGVDPIKPRMVSIIVGKKDSNDFFCHVFKAADKLTATHITQGIASACTSAYERGLAEGRENQSKSGHRSGSAASHMARSSSGRRKVGGGGDSRSESIRRAMSKSSRQPVNARRASVKAKPGQNKRRSVTPQLSDPWFAPHMSRGDVQKELRDAEIGSFIIRESNSQPGDYALSVQIGNNIWHGLINNTDRGYKLGRDSKRFFEDLCSFVDHYTEWSFVSSAWGEPVFLVLPPGSGKPISTSRNKNGNSASAFGNPYEEEDDGYNGANTARGRARSGSGSAFGNPYENEDDDHSDANVDSSRGRSPSTRSPPPIFEEPELEDLELPDHAPEELKIAHASGKKLDISNIMDNIDFFEDQICESSEGEGESDESDDGEAAPIEDIVERIYADLPKDPQGFVSGANFRPLLMKSGLSVQILGNIWMQVDHDKKGKLDRDQITLVLGLISMAQRGLSAALEDLDPDTVPPPEIEGYEASE